MFTMPALITAGAPDVPIETLAAKLQAQFVATAAVGPCGNIAVAHALH